MKNHNFILIPIFSLFILISCNKSSDITEPNSRTYEDIQEDFNNITFETGNNDISIENLNGNTWGFRVVMPDVDFTNNDRPLIISLHGCTTCGVFPDAHKNTDCLESLGFSSLNAIILSPNSHGESWTTLNNYEQIFSLIDLASTYLPIDTNKIVIHGYSDGGNASWFFGETESNIFSAAVPIATQYNTISNGIGRQMPIPFYVIHGENDTFFPLSNVQNWVNTSVNAGSDITLVVAPGLTHTEPCEYISHLQNASDWLLNDVWN